MVCEARDQPELRPDPYPQPIGPGPKDQKPHSGQNPSQRRTTESRTVCPLSAFFLDLA